MRLAVIAGALLLSACSYTSIPGRETVRLRGLAQHESVSLRSEQGPVTVERHTTVWVLLADGRFLETTPDEMGFERSLVRLGGDPDSPIVPYTFVEGLRTRRTDVPAAIVIGTVGGLLVLGTMIGAAAATP